MGRWHYIILGIFLIVAAVFIPPIDGIVPEVRYIIGILGAMLIFKGINIKSEPKQYSVSSKEYGKLLKSNPAFQDFGKELRDEYKSFIKPEQEKLYKAGIWADAGKDSRGIKQITKKDVNKMKPDEKQVYEDYLLKKKLFPMRLELIKDKYNYKTQYFARKQKKKTTKTKVKPRETNKKKVKKK